MNVLITGANGQLGRTIMDEAAGSCHDIVYTSRLTEGSGALLRLDICDRDAIEAIMTERKIDVIVNCAGYTNVERAESEEDEAFKANAEAVGFLAQAAKAHDAVLIHISTDYVFDGGASEPYGEDAAPAPLSAYGRSKLAGELAVLASGCRHMIIRTSWLYGSHGKNFVSTIRTKSAELSSLKVVSDQFGSPTYAVDLAKFILALLEPVNLEKTGIYNYSNEGVCSWYELACEVCSLSGAQCEVRPCSTDEYPVKARRPLYSVLDKSKIKAVFGVEVPHWKDSLRLFMTK